VKNGIVQVRWDSVIKTLGMYSNAVVIMDTYAYNPVSLLSSLPPTAASVVLYIILPQRVLSAPWFQPFLLKLKSGSLLSTANESHEHITIHLVPSSIVFDHNATPSDSRQQLESVALALYDRIPRIIGRRIRRHIIPLSFPAQTTVHVPAFALARPLAPRFRFSMDWPDRQREVMDRHMFLHVAYAFSKSRRWLCAACLDERGEAYETKVWRVSGVPEEDDVGESEEDLAGRGARMNKYVNLVWGFAMKFAKRAAIEWRVVICRMGIISVEELEGAYRIHTR
jgi:mediator of RNA polymerase II transcription subunit 13